MAKRSIFILIALFMLWVMPVSAAQLLPASPWYTVVYQPESDTLHWINAAGEQASLPRPTLPGEAQYRDLRIAPNGRTLVMVSTLTSGLEGLGIYDLATGAFVQAHQAQPGETINLGGENIFTANSQYFAVGFSSGDFASPAWRVILFETQTGSATAFIDHTHPNAPQVQLSAPAVQYLDATAVHFQLIPQSVGGALNWPAYAWQVFGFDPAQPAISPSPYTYANTQVNLLTGEVVASYTDAAFPAAQQNGPLPNQNAIGKGQIGNGSALATIHADGTRSHLAARWAKGSEWVLFLSDDSQSNRHWNIALANGTPGNNSYMPFDPQFIQTYGTGDGYLLVNNTYNLFYTNGFMPNTALNIAQLTPASQIVYVTPAGANFMLDQLPDSGGPVVGITPTNAAVIVTSPPPVAADCSQAPAQRVGVGGQARVVLSMNLLNVRQSPNGAILTTFNGGDSFSITNGPACADGLYWWQVNRFGTTGWVAEGTASGYFIEPFDGAAPPPPPPPAVDTATDTPVPPPPPPPAGPQEESGGNADDSASEPGCGRARANILAVGMTARLGNDYNPRSGPNGSVLPYVLAQGTNVNIVAGPVCADGLRWWTVVGSGIPRATNVQPSSGPFWMPDSTGRIGRLLRPVS